MTVAIAGAVRWAAGFWMGCGCLLVVWKLSGGCLLLDRRSWVVWRLSGGCLAVVWPRTRTFDRTGAADFVGGVSVTVAIAGAAQWAAGLWRSAVAW